MTSIVAQVNAMTANLNKAIACGPACEEQRETKKLYDKFQAAKQWKVQGPETLFKSRKDYWVFTEGEQVYDEKMLEKYRSTAGRDAESELAAHEGRMQDIARGIKEVSVGKETLAGLERLHKILATEAKELGKAENDALGKVHTNSARVSLSVSADDTLQTVRTIVWVVYWVALAVYIWKGPFITGRQYNSIMGWVTLVLLLLLGYFSAYVTTQLMRFYSIVLWLFADNTPRDVYTDLDP